VVVRIRERYYLRQFAINIYIINDNAADERHGVIIHDRNPLHDLVSRRENEPLSLLGDKP